MLWEPQRKWEGQDAYLIGGGASLRSFDFNLLKGLNTLGCNDAYRLGREISSECIFGDASWWHKNIKVGLGEYGSAFTVAPSLMRIQTRELIHLTRQRLGLHRGNVVGWNFSTGAAAINLAANMGAKRIFLLGYDLRLEDGKSHWHGHRKETTRQIVFGRFIRGFKKVAEDAPKFEIEIIHVIDGVSSLPFFMQMPFREFYSILPRNKDALMPLRCRACGEVSGGEFCLECTGEMIEAEEMAV